MTETSFWFLLDILEPHMKISSETNDKESRKKHRNGAKNGLIPAETRLSVALRFFAGGRPEDIMLVHGISFVEVYKSLWAVVDAVNSCENPTIAFTYPSDHKKQRQIASEFHSKSNADFDCCAGAIDCMLVWVEKSKGGCCQQSKVGAKKFYCGRKKKFGLCMQAVSDTNSRFMDVSIKLGLRMVDY